MAGFGDSDDIKISVTLDTKDAVDATEQLKVAIQQSLAATEKQFEGIQKLSRTANAALIEDIRSKERIQLQALENQAKADKRRHVEALAQIDPEIVKTKLKYQNAIKEAQDAAQKEITLAKQIADEKAKALQKETEDKLKAETLKVRAAEAAARELAEKEKTARTQLLKDIAQLNKESATIKKGPRLGLEDSFGDGKSLFQLNGALISLQTQFGAVTVSARDMVRAVTALGPVGIIVGSVAASYGVLRAAVEKTALAVDGLAVKAGQLEGLKTGFETLQRTVGQVPTESINRLREATQGLISDTDLYQRANQAVLLGVPTKTFNEAAAAAVKLGRAMGIDAAFGLESLSLGLGRQSRLYLDNLGIIVSAEEAYRNFGIANNIVGRQLTDSEKKLAFFEEALKKIKERADELPPIFDNVGVSVKRLEVAQSNVNTRFFEGFNRSSELSEAYSKQAKAVQSTADTYERLGEIIAYLATPVKALQLVLISLENTVLKDLVLSIDRTFGISKVQQAEDLTNAVGVLENKLKSLNESLDNDQVPSWARKGTRDEITKTSSEIEKAKKGLEDLGYVLGTVQAKGAEGVKIKIDVSEIDAAKLRLAGLFDELQADVLSVGGDFEIPGLSQETLKPALEQYRELIRLRKEGAIGADEAKTRFGEIIDPVKLDIQNNKLRELQRELEIVSGKQAILAVNGKAADSELERSAEALRQTIKKVSDGYGIQEEAVERLKKAFKGYGKEGEAAAEKAAKAQKKVVKETNALTKEQQQLRDLTKSLGRALDQAVPKNVQKKLVDTFNAPQQSAEELRAKIQAIGEEFLKSGGDYQAFAKEVAGLNDLKNQLPDRPLVGGVEETKALDAYNDNLRQVQSSMLNLRDLIFGEEFGEGGKKKGGGFFGFDLGEAFSAESEAMIAGEFQNFLSTAFQAGADGFSREDVPAIASSIGSALGAAIGAYFGGPVGAQIGAQVGGILGGVLGESLAEIGKDTAGTKAKKEIDRYFADLFDGDRLAVIVEGELTGAIDQATGEAIRSSQPTIKRFSDLVFSGLTPFAGNVKFGIEDVNAFYQPFSSYFQTLSTEVQSTFTGIGVAFGSLLGQTEEQAILIGTAIANNIGGSLENLQVFIQATGESFENLANAIVENFLNAKLSIEVAYKSLLELFKIFEDGIPGVTGAFEQAAKNFRVALENNLPGRVAIDSFRDVAAELKEVGVNDIRRFAEEVGKAFGFTAEQTDFLFRALQANGIKTIDDLLAASNDKLIALLENVRRGKEGITEIATLPTTPPPARPTNLTQIPRGGGGGGSSAPKGKSPAEIAAELLKQQREEARKLLQDSTKYLTIIEQIAAKEISRATAGKEIVRLQNALLALVKKRDLLEKQLNEELDKGAKANKKRLADLAAALEKVQGRLEKVTEKAKEASKPIDISKALALVKTVDQLGVVARSTGVELEKSVDILVQGFLRGSLSIREVNDQIAKVRDNLGQGIPGKIGAITEAFQNLVNAGIRGGQFSLDSFRDIFAEFQEGVEKNGGAIREERRKQIVAEIDAANAAFTQSQNLSGQAFEDAKKRLDAANKALDDFYSSAATADLSDLRTTLEKSFSKEQVAIFFRALGENGLGRVEDLLKASDDVVIKLLGRLDELGFKFAKGATDASKINDQLREADKIANGGKDPLAEAVEIVKQFNAGADTLQRNISSTTSTIAGLAGPLSKLASDFQNVITKLSQLSGQTYENTIIFNVRTQGDQRSQNIADIVFGTGGTVSSDTGSTGQGLTDKQRNSLESKLNTLEARLASLKKANKGNSTEAETIRSQIRKIRGQLR